MCARLQLNFVSVPSIVASSSNPWCSALQAGTQLAISALLHSAWYSWTPLDSAPPLPSGEAVLPGGQQKSKSKEPDQQLLSPVGPFVRSQHRSAV